MKFNKLLLILVSTALLFFHASGQIAPKVSPKADNLYAQFNFLSAAKIYDRLIKKDTMNIAAKQRLADCYRLINRSDLSEVWYGQLANTPGVDPINKYYYAQALRSNGKYEEAKQYYTEYAGLSGANDERAKEILRGISYIELLDKDNPAYTIQCLALNTTKSDFGPCMYQDLLLFASNRQNDIIVRRTDVWTGKSFLKIYSSKVDSVNNCSKPILFKRGRANGPFHEGPVAIDKALNDMYVTRSNYVNKPIKSTDKTVKLKIFRLVFNTATNEWGDEILDDFPYNSNQYSCAHPTISRDGQELYFVSDMPGGMGGSDIYLCKKEGAIWGQPQNLKEVNTAGEEMFPFIADNGSLYFSSDGHFGLGGLDIYVISKVDNKWSKIANLGAPLNSSKDDFAYTENESGSRGYFTSNRAGGIGDDDIYNFVKEGLKICGEVVDADTKAKLANATVKLYEGTVLKKTTEANSIGAFCFEAEPYKKYRVVASKDGYSNNEMIVDFKNQTQNIIVPLKKSNVLTLDVLVIDFKTKLPIPASDIKLIDLKTNKEAATVTDADGKTNYGLEADVDYKIIASKDLGNSSIEQYFNNSTTFNTEGIKSRANFNITIELRKEKAGVGIKIPDIYYDLDKYNIRIDAAKELEKIVKILKDNPTMEIELSSHTDCRSGARYNMWLSAKRAEAAVNYIIRQGINPYRMVAAGYGETRLVNNCACEPDNNSSCSEEEHQLNRRTEFKILKF